MADNRSARLLILLIGAVPAAILLVVILSGWMLPREPSAPSSEFLVEFPVPFGQGNPLNIVIESPGRLWFTMPSANAIGSLVVTDTNDYQFTLFQVPTPDSQPYDLVYDHARDGLWFTEQAGNKIGFLETATGIFTETIVPTAASAPAGIDLSPDGTVWFVERDANKLAQYDPGSDTLTEFPYDFPIEEPAGELEDVAVESADSIWFTAPGVLFPRVVWYVPSGGSFINLPVNSGPGPVIYSFPAYKIVVRSGSRVWVTAPDFKAIGLFQPGTSALWRWYLLPVSDGGLADLAHTWDGDFNYLWYTDSVAGKVGLLITDRNTGAAEAVRQIGLSGSSSVPMGIAAGSNHEPWIADYGGLSIAKWQAPYSYGIYLPLLNR